MTDKTSETQKHTPGPWRAAHSDPAEGADVWWICAGEGNYEKELGSFVGGYPHDRNEANARLAAAAPDLLDALEAVLFAGWCGESSRITDNVRKAIAKARGQ
jgi:hypothetical protein